MKYLFALALLILPTAAHADYYVWQDAKSGLTMTYPDTWELKNNRNPDEVLSILAPSNGDDPTCKIRVSDDTRYTIYPAEYGDAVQRDAVSIDFWKSYMASYDDYAIDKVYDGGGVGRWHASYAIGSYTQRNGTTQQSRQAIMFASLYYNKLYVVECSALNHAYDRWDNDFRSIIKSIDFKKMYNERPTGEYHDFLKGSEMYFWSQTGPEGTTKY